MGDKDPKEIQGLNGQELGRPQTCPDCWIPAPAACHCWASESALGREDPGAAAWSRGGLQGSCGGYPREDPQASFSGVTSACGSTQEHGHTGCRSHVGCSPGLFPVEGTLPPAGALPSRHQTTAGTDSSPEETLRQAGCKQQQGRGRDAQRELSGAEVPSGGGGRGKGEAAGKGTSEVGTLRAPENLSMLISHTP